MSAPLSRTLISVAFCLLFVAPTSLSAQIGVGTWERKETAATPGKMTMTVTACCGNGRRLVYRFEVNGAPTTLTVDSKFDGSETPVLIGGKPSGETMAITWVDDRHTFTVLKLNGQPFGTSKSTLSADGRTLTVENDFSSSVGGQQAGKFTEIWTHQ